MRACNGICDRFKIKVVRAKGSHWWNLGIKKCTTCNIFLKSESLMCPCCKSKLSTNPKSNRNDRY